MAYKLMSTFLHIYIRWNFSFPSFWIDSDRVYQYFFCIRYFPCYFFLSRIAVIISMSIIISIIIILLFIHIKYYSRNNLAFIWIYVFFVLYSWITNAYSDFTFRIDWWWIYHVSDSLLFTSKWDKQKMNTHMIYG